MKIGIIDADLIAKKAHRFPNLVCMKLSGYHKNNGDNVMLKTDYQGLEDFDKVYIAKVFTDTAINEDVLKLPNVIYGGTGFYYDKAKALPYEIEHTKPDYHLYDEWVASKIDAGEPSNHFKYYTDYSIGFTTRGCFRKCPFCVNKNYSKVSKHSPVTEFLDNDRKKICLLDDNILGYSGWREVLQELKDTRKPFQYKQGMDERILTEDKCKMLASCKYDGDYIYAFDNIQDKEIVIEKAKLLRKHFKQKSKIKFYVLCAYDRAGKYNNDFWIQDIADTLERIFILARYGFKPYIMRYAKYKESPYYGTYVNLAKWCNQPFIFSKMSYKDFCIADDDRRGGKRTSSSYRYYTELKNKFEQEFNINPSDLYRK